MRPIPEKLKKELSQRPFYKQCAITGKPNPEWHHSEQYRGRQINAKFAILPLSKSKHRVDNDSAHKNQNTRQFCTYLSIRRASREELTAYPKRNWKQEYKFLHPKFKDDPRIKRLERLFPEEFIDKKNFI
jgi:hypothetical protein